MIHQLSAAEHLWEHQLVGKEVSDNGVVLLTLQGAQAIRQGLEPVCGQWMTGRDAPLVLWKWRSAHSHVLTGLIASEGSACYRQEESNPLAVCTSTFTVLPSQHQSSSEDFVKF